MTHRGFFEIGIYQPKKECNIGTLWRSAYQLGANGIFVIGKRYEKQSSDTCKTYRHIPLRYFTDFENFYDIIPYDCRLIGIEMGGIKLSEYKHPESCVYLLGAEDYGLPDNIKEYCYEIISLESIRMDSYNVAMAGTVVMYDRMFRK